MAFSSFSANTILLVKHIIADIENLSVYLDEVLEDLKEQHKRSPSLPPQEISRVISMNQLTDYAMYRLRIFYENSKWFGEKVNCNCKKCCFIGFSTPSETAHDLELEMKFLKGDVIIMKDTLPLNNLTSEVIKDRIFLFRFMRLVNYLRMEFMDMFSTNEDIIPFIKCLDYCCRR